MSDIKSFPEVNEQLSRYYKALSNPTRLAIIHYLAEQHSCYFGCIHDILPIAKATVSQHLKELTKAGLVQREEIATKVKYCINRQAWEEFNSLFRGMIDKVEKGLCGCN